MARLERLGAADELAGNARSVGATEPDHAEPAAAGGVAIATMVSEVENIKVASIR